MQKRRRNQFDHISDKLFRSLLISVTVIVLIVLVSIFITLITSSWPSVKEHGLRFFTSQQWNYRRVEVQSIEAVPSTNSVFGGYNDRNVFIRFTGAVDFSSVNSNNVRIAGADGNAVAGNLELADGSFSNVVVFIPFAPFVENETYAVSVDSGVRDTKRYDLASDYRYSFTMGNRDGEGFQSGDLVYADSGEVVTITTDVDQAVKWFGSLPFVVGTLLTSLIALAISLPFSLALAIFLGEYFTFGPMSTMLKTTNELLAGIPSVIYGFWAFYFLAGSEGLNLGSNIFTASIVLSIMIIPYAASLGREVIALVPLDIKEAAYGMGATRYSVTSRVILPYASSGIFAGVLLSFGRALGETMAVTMVIGNANRIPGGLLKPGQTIASLIANEYGEARGMHLSALTELGLVLFLITMLFGLLGRFIIKKLSVKDNR